MERYTGKVRFRKGFLGKQILQVEVYAERYTPDPYEPVETYKTWIDADPKQSLIIEMCLTKCREKTKRLLNE